jgi:hypothetical protein
MTNTRGGRSKAGEEGGSREAVARHDRVAHDLHGEIPGHPLRHTNNTRATQRVEGEKLRAASELCQRNGGERGGEVTV